MINTVSWLLAGLCGVLAASSPDLPALRGIRSSGDCADAAPADMDTVEFSLFNISTTTPVTGHGVCEAVPEYDDWPVGYSMAITDATLRGHLRLPKATRLYRFKTTVFATFPSVAEFVSPDLAQKDDFDGFIQTQPLPLQPLVWTSPCRESESDPGSWTVTIRTLADVQVSRRGELAPGAVACVPARLAIGTPPLVLEDDVVKLYLDMRWKSCADN